MYKNQQHYVNLNRPDEQSFFRSPGIAGTYGK